MKTSRQEHAATFSEDLDLHYLELLRAKAPYEQCRRELLKLEKHWLRKAKTAAQRLAVQRIITSTLLTETYGNRLPWKEFGRWLRRIQKLGFHDLGMRVHVACLYVQSLHLFPRQAREAWEMLADAEQSALRLRRDRPLRQEHLESISHAKKVARVPSPPSMT
ncbi:hypothetical protein JRI60_37365 [Archangium violaceum]|uniref:hypothetical protein n=1 Tax=Archangium violaceum TaxID=83451 RepID=UPI00194E4D0E|nr:hypothetical protein [Archangium violaceum]QRN94745.1 hypothetical protein JRI60_37365 [Archangium violaceum]